MDHSSSGSHGSMGLKKAILGFVQAKEAEALSPRTIQSYQLHLETWAQYMGERSVNGITAQDVRAYLAYLRTEYVPKRFNGKTTPLSQKSLRNVYITLSSFFAWASEELQAPDPMDAVTAPKFQHPEVEPFTLEHVEALLKAAEFSREADTRDRRRFVRRRPTALRDRAIILILLDTGMRASELCAVDIGDVDQKTGKIAIKHGAEGGAKGGKGRFVYLGKAARRALWRYLTSREDGDRPDAPLLTTGLDRRLGKNALLQLINSLGEKAQVQHCYPHRFRHTFAITFLRSGGDIFTLQKLLGHSSLDMVKHYARVAQVDIEQAHRRASPADNWRL